MKYLCGRFKPPSFAGAVIQPIFNHFNFLVIDVFHRALLWHSKPLKFSFVPRSQLATGLSKLPVVSANQLVACNLGVIGWI